MSEQNCTNCFYHAAHDQDIELLVCLRYPPKVFLFENDLEKQYQASPIMHKDDNLHKALCWCGEWLHESLNPKFGGLYREGMMNGKNIQKTDG